MSSWQTNFTALCSTQLNILGDDLNALKNHYVYWNDDYYQKSQTLATQQYYQGPGATAFLQAVDTDINICRPVYDGLGHASSACHNLQNAISSASTKYDSAMTALSPLHQPPWSIDGPVFDNWRTQLLQITLRLSGGAFVDAFFQSDVLNSILQNGCSFISTNYYKAEQTVEEIVKKDADAYAAYITWLRHPNVPVQSSPFNASQHAPTYPYPPYVNSVTQQAEQHQAGQYLEISAEVAEIHAYFLAAFHQLSSEIAYNLTAWANDLSSAQRDFLNALQHSENFLSARDLFDFIGNKAGLYSTQSTTKPITITPYKTKNGTGLLISIGGTDSKDWDWDTNLFTALQTGMGLQNPYLADVKQAIVDYMAEHPKMAGSEITFAGYSLGGMTAQQLAQDITSGKDQELRGYNLHVAQVITFGSPVMGAPLSSSITVILICILIIILSSAITIPLHAMAVSLGLRVPVILWEIMYRR